MLLLTSQTHYGFSKSAPFFVQRTHMGIPIPSFLPTHCSCLGTPYPTSVFGHISSFSKAQEVLSSMKLFLAICYYSICSPHVTTTVFISTSSISNKNESLLHCILIFLCSFVFNLPHKTKIKRKVLEGRQCALQSWFLSFSYCCSITVVCIFPPPQPNPPPSSPLILSMCPLQQFLKTSLPTIPFPLTSGYCQIVLNFNVSGYIRKSFSNRHGQSFRIIYKMYTYLQIHHYKH